MSTESYKLYLPCYLFGVRMVVAPAGGATTIERLFLEAIALGVTRVQELITLFGLGQRPTLDLIFDLWQKTYIVLDTLEAKVYLTHEVKERADTGRLGTLESSARQEVKVEVLQEAVTGRLLTLRGSTAPGPAGQNIPARFHQPRVQSVSRQELARVACDVWRMTSRAHKGLDVVEARVDDRSLGAVFDRRWVSLEAEYSLDELSEEYRIRLGGERVDGRILRALESHLAQFIIDKPDHMLSRRIKESSRSLNARDLDLDTHFAELRGMIAALEGLDPGHAPRHQQRLEAKAQELEARVEERLDSQVESEPVIGHDPHEEVILDLIATSQRQLVLVCPWIKFNRLYERCIDAIRERLSKGVQVYLLWGIARDSKLSKDVRAQLRHLTDLHPNLHVASRSCTTHAKLVIQDDARALVTSYNFLDPSQDRTLEVGVLLRARGELPSCRLARELLGWIQRVFPDDRIADGILTLAEHFGHVEEPKNMGLPRPPSRLSSTSSRFVETARAMWRREWSRYADALARRGSLPLTTRLLTDAAHSRLLWSSLTSAKRRLLIASDKLSSDVVEARFLKTLKKRLTEDGLVVMLIYRRTPDRGTEAAKLSIEALESLRAELPDDERWRLKLVETKNHAKLLLSDDIAVVTSFNFLSFEGYYRSSGGREKSEVGVMLEGSAAAKAFFEILARDLSEVQSTLGALEQAEAPSARSGVVDYDSGGRFRELVARLSENELGSETYRQLAGHFKLAEDPWLDLDELAATGPDGALLMQAAAAAIATASKTGSPCGQERRWRSELARHAWGKLHFFEATLLIAGFEPEGFPPQEICQVVALAHAARLPQDLFVDAMAALDPEAVPPEAAEVIQLSALSALLRHGVATAAEPVELLAERGHLRTWSRAVLRYWHATYRPLPFDHLRRVNDLEAALALSEAGYVELTRDLELLRQKSQSLHFPAGEQTFAVLFGDNGRLSMLEGPVRDQDLSAARAWRAELDARGLDAAGILDEASERSPCGFKLRLAPRRQSIALLKSLLDALAAWLDNAEGEASGGDRRWHRAAEELAAALRAEDAALRQLSSGPAWAVAAVARAHWSLLEPLRRVRPL